MLGIRYCGSIALSLWQGEEPFVSDLQILSLRRDLSFFGPEIVEELRSLLLAASHAKLRHLVFDLKTLTGEDPKQLTPCLQAIFSALEQLVEKKMLCNHPARLTLMVSSSQAYSLVEDDFFARFACHS